MGSWWPVAAAALLVAGLAVPAQAVPWRQYGVTDDQSSYTTDPGPATDDVAWKARLSGSRAAFAWPIIMDGHAYVLEADHGLTMSTSGNHIHRFRLDTGERDATPFATLPEWALSWASDGEVIYVAGRDHVFFVSVADGSIVRTLDYPPTLVPDDGPTICRQTAIVGGNLYLFCVASGNQVPGFGQAWGVFDRPFTDGPRLIENSTMAYLYVASYDARSGALRWMFHIDALAMAEQRIGEPTLDQVVGLTGYPQVPYPGGMAVLGDHVAVSGMHINGFHEGDLGEQQGICWLFLVDAATGSIFRRYASSDDQYDGPGSEADDVTTCGMPGEPRWDPQRRFVFGKFQGAFAVDIDADRYERFQQLDAEEEVMSGAAYDGQRLFFSSYKRIQQFDPFLIAAGTPFQIPAEDRVAFADHAPILTDDTLYMVAHHDEDDLWHLGGMLYALDVTSSAPTLRWKMPLPHAAESVYGLNHLASLGDGMLVLAAMDGSVIAIGATPASPDAKAKILGKAEVGQPLRIDLGGSRPGLHGAPTAFRADWGDGTSDEWQAEPVLQHTYLAPPPSADGYLVRLQVRNDAGQTDSAFVRVLGAQSTGPAWDPPWPWLGAASAALLLLGAVLAHRHRAPHALLPREGAGGRFQVVRELGHGSFGVAQLAEDGKLGRRVVLKQPYVAGRLAAAQRERFLHEARMAARVHHPNVVTVFEVLPEEDPPIMVLEYVPGGSLEERLQRGDHLPPSEARRLTLDLLQGLAAIHAAGIVHRDLKPANILLDAEGHAKVADFGVARLQDRSPAEETRAWGAGAGTLAYMSPEQLRGQPATQASDQYAAAAIAYRLFAGRHHADGPDWSADAVRRRVLSRRVRAQDGVPPAIRAILVRALALDPADRFPDVKALLAELGSASLRPSGPTSGPT